MSLRKTATLQVLEAWRVPAQAGPGTIAKTAHRVAFDYTPRLGYLYVRSRMISSRTNDNNDTFPAGEIEKGYKTFLGKPVFVNHHNANHRRARGVVVAVALHRDGNRDGTPDTWVEGLMEVDAVKFPKLAKAILAGRVNRTSMGVDVEWSTCSACGNKATSPAEYCRHLPAMKGKKIRQRNKVTGKVEEKLIHEVCAGLSFFENSLLVEDPADPTAYVLGQVDARGLSKAAALDDDEPDFRDHLGNTCTDCGKAVGYSPPLAKQGRYPWKHRSLLISDHEAQPADSTDRTPNRDQTFGGTHCAFCHDPVQINLGALDLAGGGWHHFDGMKRDHPATPADPRAVYDAIPAAKSRLEQARRAMDDHMHRMFEQMSGHPLPRRSRGDEDQMPPDPFLAAKKREGGDHPFFHENPVSHTHIVAAYHEATDDEKALGDRWYPDGHHVAKGIAGGDAALGAGLLSAYSPQTNWPVNMFNASRAAQGDPPGPGTGAMGQQQKSAMRILSGEHHSKVLKASKTAAFAHLLEHGGQTPEDKQNGTEKVVIDRHALSVAVGRRLTKEEGAKAPLDQPQHYEHVANEYRIAARVLSKHYGRPISAEEVQAGTWLVQIRKNQTEDRSGAKGAGGKGRVQMHDNSRTRWESHHKQHHPGAIPEENMHHRGAKTRRLDPRAARAVLATARPEDYWPRTAYGETRVPPQVDTLRMEECPVCGEHDVWSGDRCPVCGFVVPPSLFRDPDTSKAQQVRQELDSSGEVTTDGDGTAQAAPGTGPDGQIGSGGDADAQLMHPDQIAPDGVPTVQGDGGPVPAADTDGQPPQDEDEEADDEDAEEADIPPGDEEDGEDGEDLPPGAEGEEEQAEGEQMVQQGEQEQQQGAQDESVGQELEEQGQAAQLGPEAEEDDEAQLEMQEPEDDLECPACGAQFAIDGAAQPGVPCPACKMANLMPLEDLSGGGEGGFPGDLGGEGEEGDVTDEPGGPQKEQEEAESDEDEGEEKMAPNSKTSAAIRQAEARRVARLTAENEVMRAQLSFLASAAGVDRELAQIRAQVMRKHADVMNPASPVPDPPQAPAPQSTEQALMSGSYGPAGNSGHYPDGGSGHTVDDPSRPGSAPGSMQHVPADSTTTSITPGVEMQTPAATQLIDVTAPTQGTNPSQDGGVPLEQRRIETDVRIDPDPLKAHGPGIGGQGDNGSAFPWLLDARQPGQKTASKTPEADGAARTFASIRLARLQITAGVAQGDELAVAASIEGDRNLSTTMIERDIATLSAVQRTAAAQSPAPRPMQRAAVRQAPSLQSVGAVQYAPASYTADDLDGADLFF